MRVDALLKLRAFALTLVTMPLPIGFVSTPTFANFGIGMTAFGNAWTTGTTSLILSNSPFTVTAMGSNALVSGQGVVTLVAATRLLTTSQDDLNFEGDSALMARLEIAYAPEPATPALVLASVAALAWGRRRRGGQRPPGSGLPYPQVRPGAGVG